MSVQQSAHTLLGPGGCGQRVWKNRRKPLEATVFLKVVQDLLVPDSLGNLSKSRFMVPEPHPLNHTYN